MSRMLHGSPSLIAPKPITMAAASCSFCSSSLGSQHSSISFVRKPNVLSSSVNLYSQCTMNGIMRFYHNIEFELKDTAGNFRHSNLTKCELLSGLQSSCVSNMYLKLAKMKFTQIYEKSQRYLVARLFDPVEFDPSKLTINFMDTMNPADVAKPSQLIPRKYTLTHNDITAEIYLTIGSNWNKKQVEGWYTKLLRDEIIAEWRCHGESNQSLSLHIFCHVSGSHSFMLPARLRNWIFKREMPLVLKAIMTGDQNFLELYPELETATVWVHYQSCQSEFNRADCLGPLIYAANRYSKDSNLDLDLILDSSSLPSPQFRDLTAKTNLLLDPVFCLNEISTTNQLTSKVKQVSLTKRDG